MEKVSCMVFWLSRWWLSVRNNLWTTAGNACLHKTVFPTGKAKVTSSILCETMEDSENSQDSVGDDAFEESVVDATRGQSFYFVLARCWFFSDFCWLFLVLLVPLTINWIYVGCWHERLCVLMCRSCTSSCFSIKPNMSSEEVSEALPPHGFGVPDLYPDRVHDDSNDEGYDSAWDLHTVRSTFKQSLFSVFMSQSRRIELQTKQTHVIITVVYVFSWEFSCYLPSPTCLG